MGARVPGYIAGGATIDVPGIVGKVSQLALSFLRTPPRSCRGTHSLGTRSLICRWPLPPRNPLYLYHTFLAPRNRCFMK